MKSGILFLILGCCFLQTHAQKITFKPITPHNDIICTLFEGRWDSLKQECVWKPNLAEKFDFEEFYNDSLYTSLVTTFYYQIENDLYALSITSTYSKDENGQYYSYTTYSPTMSSILLKYNKNAEIVEVEHFKKHVNRFGSQGFTPQDISLMLLGATYYFVQVVDYDHVDRQYYTQYTTLYYQGEKKLRFTSYYVDVLVGEDNLPQTIQYATTMSIDKATHKITLHKKGTELVTNPSKLATVIPVDESKTYQFNGTTFELVAGN